VSKVFDWIKALLTPIAVVGLIAYLHFHGLGTAPTPPDAIEFAAKDHRAKEAAEFDAIADQVRKGVITTKAGVYQAIKDSASMKALTASFDPVVSAACDDKGNITKPTIAAEAAASVAKGFRQAK
jgi:hypothetical protein